MDLQDERRALVLSSTLARKQRTELDWSGWNDYYVVLLDNYREQVVDFRRLLFNDALHSNYYKGREAFEWRSEIHRCLTGKSVRI